RVENTVNGLLSRGHDNLGSQRDSHESIVSYGVTMHFLSPHTNGVAEFFSRFGMGGALGLPAASTGGSGGFFHEIHRSSSALHGTVRLRLAVRTSRTIPASTSGASLDQACRIKVRTSAISSSLNPA